MTELEFLDQIKNWSSDAMRGAIHIRVAELQGQIGAQQMRELALEKKFQKYQELLKALQATLRDSAEAGETCYYAYKCESELFMQVLYPWLLQRGFRLDLLSQCTPAEPDPACMYVDISW